MRLGLRTRVALAFGGLSLIVAILISGATYLFARYNLVQQRESTSITRALIDARVVESALLKVDTSGDGPVVTLPGDVLVARTLDELPSLGGSQPMVRVRGTWFIRGVSVSPADLPTSLLDAGVAQVAVRQRIAVGGAPYLAVVVDLGARAAANALDPDALEAASLPPPGSVLYVEVFPLEDLQSTLTALLVLLAASSAGAFLVGGGIGMYAGASLLRPLRQLAAGAGRISAGDLSVRLPPVGDPDLDPMAAAFNEMATAVESRIARERRFAANVSHELRSPLTTIMGTTELLESGSDRLPVRDSTLIAALAAQVRRFSRTVVDLLEISRIESDDAVQREVVDLHALVQELLRQRDLDTALLAGESAEIRTDARRVERIVGNLIDNAGLHGGGVVAVAVERDADRVSITVDDDGPGVADEERVAIFEPFTRGATSAGRHGAGLGLAIAREQALKIGGTLAVGRSPSGGARFAVSLPGPVATGPDVIAGEGG